MKIKFKVLMMLTVSLTFLIFLIIVQFDNNETLKSNIEESNDINTDWSEYDNADYIEDEQNDDLINDIVKSNNLKLADDHKYNFIINPGSEFCEDTRNVIQLLTLVIVEPNDFDKRSIIRSVWLDFSRARTLFLVGKSIEDDSVNEKLKYESKVFQDILQQDFVDTYLNQTYKTMMGIEWASKYCKNAQFILKIEASTVVNVGALEKYLDEQFNQTYPSILDDRFEEKVFYNTFYGIKGNSYIVDREDVYYPVSINEYPFEKFPDYCKGSHYLFTADLASKLYKLSKYVKKFCIEDVYIGVLANYLETSTIDMANQTAVLYNDYWESIVVDKKKIEDLLFFWTSSYEEFWYAQNKMVIGSLGEYNF
jgi:beta-1,3-galactosyltransferase 2